MTTTYVGSSKGKGNMAWAYDALVFGLTEPSEQMVEKVKNSLRTMIDNALDGFSEDDCLGVEELTFTQDELQKAIYFNGQPLEKSLHFRGDDSHYRAIFHLKLVRPIKK